MQKIRIVSVGKTKEAWLDEAIQDYIQRMQSSIAFEFSWVKNDTQLISTIEKDNRVICLDPNGRLMTSEKFSVFLVKELEAGGSRLTFVIGGAEGLPEELRRKHPLISLSPLTFTHQLTRLVLIEQIYRGLEIAKGSPYHKA